MRPTPIAEIIAKNPQLNNLESEDILDLAAIPTPRDTGNFEILNCNNFLELNDQYVEFLAAQATCDAFDKLFFEASKMWNGTDNYITGLKIYFGMTQTGSNIITPIFQPLHMRKFSPNGSYSIVGEGSLYALDNGEFLAITPEEFTTRTDMYKDEIRIKRNGPSLPYFKPGVDVEAVIFPFQTIFTLIHDNPGLSGVFFYNAIRKSTIKQENIAQHCMLLFYSEMYVWTDMYDKYANRSHLCPPDCNILRYSVYQYR